MDKNSKTLSFKDEWTASARAVDEQRGEIGLIAEHRRGRYLYREIDANTGEIIFDVTCSTKFDGFVMNFMKIMFTRLPVSDWKIVIQE